MMDVLMQTMDVLLPRQRKDDELLPQYYY